MGDAAKKKNKKPKGAANKKGGGALPSDEELASAIGSWLDDQRCCLFGRAFDIKSGRSRQQCIEFLVATFKSIDSEVRSCDDPS